jgi:uncharacterized protein (DUF1778 family)
MYARAMDVKTEHLNLRLTSTQDAILRSAAEARGESISDYVLRHAVVAAEMDLETGVCLWLMSQLGRTSKR